MKYILNIMTLLTLPTVLTGASESSSSQSQAKQTLLSLHILPKFNSAENHLQTAHRIILSIKKSSRVDQPTKTVLNTVNNALLWFASQNDQTKIKSGQKGITAIMDDQHITAKFLQHCWFGYRQMQQARQKHGLPVTNRYLTFMTHLEGVTKEAFKVCSYEPRNFEQPTVKESLSKLQAYSGSRSAVTKRSRLESPTKKERATTQQITSFFKPIEKKSRTE